MRDIKRLFIASLAFLIAVPVYAANIKFRSGQSRGRGVVRARNARTVAFRVPTVNRLSTPPASSDEGPGETAPPTSDSAATSRLGKVHPRRNFGYSTPAPSAPGVPLISINDSFLARIQAKHKAQAASQAQTQTSSLSGNLGASSTPAPSYIIQIPGAAPLGGHNRDQGGKPQGPGKSKK
jgi:hypothetical protein